ncbi:MAG: hypothetical protein CM15mV18_1240 [uncultured marine virus]|nr:MAG: hypothetical protein CM15mV18_1240 [uncultured marine virus]
MYLYCIDQTLCLLLVLHFCFYFFNKLCNSFDEPTNNACLIFVLVLSGTCFSVFNLLCKSCNLSTVSTTCLIKLFHFIGTWVLTFVCNIKYDLVLRLASFYKIIIIFSTIFVIIITSSLFLSSTLGTGGVYSFFTTVFVTGLVVRDIKGLRFFFVYAHNYSSLSVVWLYVFESAKLVIVVVNQNHHLRQTLLD